jgi:hypothetical protein
VISWTRLPAPGLGAFHVDAERLGVDLLAAVRTPLGTLRDDQRSRVLLVQPPAWLPEEFLRRFPAPWVMKRPLWRDGRCWNRLMSLFGEGEMRRALRGGLRLAALGLSTPDPLLVLERRRCGLLVESWLAYVHKPGDPVREAHWPGVVEALERLHEAGLRHGDPHLANWLAAEDGSVVALDPAPRPMRDAVDAAYDFVLLRNCEPRLLPLIPGTDGEAWRRAEARNARVQGWRSWKRRMRGQS